MAILEQNGKNHKEDVKTNFNLKVMASSLDSGTSTAATSSLSTITVSMEAKADPVGIEVNNSSCIYINFLIWKFFFIVRNIP